MRNTHRPAPVPSTVPLINTITVDGHTINIRSHHGSWQAAQVAVARLTKPLATTPVAQQQREGISTANVVV